MGLSMFRFALVAVLIFIAGAAALADAIDGSWCAKDGKQLNIADPEITLPNDAKIQGAYRRHEFLYTAPAGDPDAGVQIYLQLQSDDALNSYHIKDNQAVDPVAWASCAIPPKTS